MNAEEGMSPGPEEGGRGGKEDRQAGWSPGSEGAFRDNQQWLGSGAAVMGEVRGDFVYVAGMGALDDDASNRILKPKLREGPYPADEVREKLRGFVEPLSYARCRKVLDSHVLVLRAGSGEGSTTTAFALLAERYGAGGITGLDSMENLAAWSPKDGRGYLLQGLSQAAADGLGEVALTSLAELLRQAGAHLLITVTPEATLSADTVPWQVVHLPPPPRDVAVKRLHMMTEASELTSTQVSVALRHLGSREFTDYLRAHALPGDGVDVADGLREMATAGTSADSVLEDLLTGSASAAQAALKDSRRKADGLSLMAAIALLSSQDRTVIEQFTAVLRPLMSERAGPPDPEAVARTGAPDVLGPAFQERLTAVGARLLPAQSGSAQRDRYPVQPVVFSGRHRSETLLRHLWLDYEDMPELLWKALGELPYQPGLDLAAGQAIGRVLAHATGPRALGQLLPFAASEKRWRRRLVAVVLGELVQHPPVAGAVKDQLRRWSRSPSPFIRCTVAEACAGSYGLARPTAALKLLDTVLGSTDTDLDRRLRTAVSFALSTLLTEETNHTAVFDKVMEWLASADGTSRHTLAVHVVESMSLSTFPQAGSPGASRMSMADVLEDRPGQALDLVVLALDDPATHEVTARVLFRIEAEPETRERTDFDHFLKALSMRARSHRGVVRFVLRRHRDRTAASQEGFPS